MKEEGVCGLLLQIIVKIYNYDEKGRLPLRRGERGGVWGVGV